MFKTLMIFAAIFLLVGCIENEVGQSDVADVVIDHSLPVVVYFALEENSDDQRWQNFIAISVNSDDVVTEVSLNSIAPFANNSRRNVAQLEGFEDIFKYDFHGQASLLEQSLVGTTRAYLADALLLAYVDEKVDFDTADFANLATTALATTPMDRGPYADGVYMSINQDGEAFDYFVYLFVVHGHIKAVHFNGFDSDNSLKYDAFSNAPIEEEITNWREQAELFEEALLLVQDPLVFTFCTDGYTADIDDFNLEAIPFINLVVEALARGPIIIIN